MTIYIPLVYFETAEEDKEIADCIFHGFYTLEDAKILHPTATIITVETDSFNYQDN